MADGTRLDYLPDNALLKQISDIETDLTELKNAQFTASDSMRFYIFNSGLKTDQTFTMNPDPANPGGYVLGLRFTITAQNAAVLFSDIALQIYYANNSTLWNAKDYYNFTTNYLVNIYPSSLNTADPHVNAYDLIVFGSTASDVVGIKYNIIASDLTNVAITRFL